MIRNASGLLERLRALHAAIRDDVVAMCERMAIEQLSEVVGHEAGDTIFAIDRVSEAVLVERFNELASEWSCVLVAEGLGATGQVVLPPGTAEERAELRIIVDPIDGTRGLMYQKRSAWILTGVAANRGRATTLADIQLALQTEIPLVKQHLCDSLWAIAGEGASGERLNRLTGERVPLAPRPSQAATVEQGYGGIARFFPGGRARLAAVDDAVVERLLGPPQPGRALAYEDQYISSGGQLYELMLGHDRWIADLRPLLGPVLASHPYDLCTELVAREAGVSICDVRGLQLAAPLDVTTPVAWAGYANAAIRAQVEPALQAALIEHKLL